jgi:hypothetical protein
MGQAPEKSAEASIGEVVLRASELHDTPWIVTGTAHPSAGMARVCPRSTAFVATAQYLSVCRHQ